MRGIDSQVRGVTTHAAPASLALRALAFFADLGWILAVFLLTVRTFTHSVIPTSKWIFIFAAEFGLFWTLQRILFRKTLGERIWKLKAAPTKKFGPMGAVYLQSALDSTLLASAGFLTAGCWVITFAALQSSILSQPAYLQAHLVSFDGYAPEVASAQSEWTIIPFFYTLGAWPRKFLNRLVFYSLPYAKGPPRVFVDHVQARWRLPDIRMTADGPKTPPENFPRDEIKKCLTSPPDSDCLKIRDGVLSRHIHEIQNFLGKSNTLDWNLKWFTVSNTAIPEATRPQGVYIRANALGSFEERYVLISANGTHQSFILDAPKTPIGEQAHELMEKAIRSIRISDDLNEERTWADREIQNVKLSQSPTLDQMELVQSILISKITTDPKPLDTFYFLALNAMQIQKYALAHLAQAQEEDFSAIAKPLVRSAFKYAQDIAPLDPKTSQLENMWLEAEKY